MRRNANYFMMKSMPFESKQISLLLLVVTVLAACGQIQAGGPAAGRNESASSEPAKTLVLIARTEPETLAGTALTALTGSTGTRRRLFNAALTMLDGNDQPVPYLAEALPGLNSESWRVFPDGRMETMYRLRPNLTWHDGAALTAHDFAFAFQVYTTPELGRSNSEPINMMEGVTAEDDRALRISWKQPYILADVFSPDMMPAHLLEESFRASHESLTTHPWLASEYVGNGPFKLKLFEPGAFMVLTAFDKM